MVLYPHTLVATAQNSNAILNPSGNWVQQDDEGSIISLCRFQASSGYRFIELQDGTKLYFTGIVYAPLTLPDIEVGAALDVRDIGDHPYQTAGTVDPVEIVITPEMADQNIVQFPALKGKQYRLDRRGVGTLQKDEFTYLADGGFAFTDPEMKVKEGEVFFAFLKTESQIPTADLLAAKLLISSTVKQFFRSQLNCRIWL